MRLTLIITTYERVDALSAVLSTLAQQVQSPDELVVADAGSDQATRRVVEQFGERAGFPVHHVWQEHQGFRAARVRNLAIARASGDYSVFVDGDMLLHPWFIADHRRHARRGTFTQGTRIQLDAGSTRRALQSPGAHLGVTSSGLGGLRRLCALHAPRLSSLARRLANGFVAVKSCNLGVWREHLLAVNGFNEDFVGWGPEDKELVARLEHNHVRRQTLLFGGIAYHLQHAPAARDHLSANAAILAATRARRLTRCEHGLDSYLPTR